MCGIAGIWSKSSDLIENKLYVQNMIQQINHRGPDFVGFWEDELEGIFLGHGRLSILDLSVAGHQPMISKSGKYVISFNGEIYNHSDLKKELEKKTQDIKWVGHSDTEILLELIDTYGLEKALNKCIGMFAIALWNKEENSLTLVRDRIGEKPLYYGFTGQNEKESFLFGSELSALKNLRIFKNEINPLALSELLNYQVISAPNCIFKNIFQLEPGHLVKIISSRKEDLGKSIPWWRLSSCVDKSFEDQISNEKEAIIFMERTLREAIKMQSIADVPLGAFLSGGIDSSLITALLQKESANNVKTFTIGFENKNFDEAPFAREVAKYLNTDHNEFYLTSKDAQNLIPSLSKIYSEPFADSSQLPTHLVCREARNYGLKVALSGDGGDELFGGYNRYFLGEKIWKKANLLPWKIRRIFGEVGIRLPNQELDSILKIFGINQIGTKISKLSSRLKDVRNEDEFYYSLISLWNNPSFLFHEDYQNQLHHTFPKAMKLKLPLSIKDNLTAKMMFYDALNYLPNDILTKVDRAAMAASLETRAPFLDHRVIEGAWRINMGLKVKSNKWLNTNKWVLRKILYKYVPKKLIERPKAGFAIPLADWLRGSLRIWAGDLLSKENINKNNYLNYSIISSLWEDHLSGRVDNSAKLWPIIMWQSWLDNN